MFFNQKNIWNWGVKTDFVNFHHMVVLNSRFALALTVFPQFQKLRLCWSMVFTKEFEFQFQKFITSLLRNLIFQPSEAPLSMVLQNLSKLISFHYWVPKGLTNFEWWFWNFHTLNYDNAMQGYEMLSSHSKNKITPFAAMHRGADFRPVGVY